jgi:hypothetical protein
MPGKRAESAQSSVAGSEASHKRRDRIETLLISKFRSKYAKDAAPSSPEIETIKSAVRNFLAEEKLNEANLRILD